MGVEGGDSDPIDSDKYNLTADTVFVAQYLNAYSGFDNGYSSNINLFFDTNLGVLYIYGEDDNVTEVSIAISITGNDITVLFADGDDEGFSGTFINNTLNITLEYNGQSFVYGIGSVDPSVTYTVTYDLNGGTGTLPTESEKSAGVKFNLAASTGFANGDKTFAGWNDGSKTYAAGAEYTMPNANVTFTAQWKDKPSGSDWQDIGSITSGPLFDYVNQIIDSGKASALFLFPQEFEGSKYTFIGLQFEIVTLGSDPYLRLKPVYYETANKQGTLKAGTTISDDATNTDPLKLCFKSSSYRIEIQYDGSDFYMTYFKYSTYVTKEEQLILTYTTKTIEDLKNE